MILPDQPTHKPLRLLATGLVTDGPNEGTTFPSAGGNSADPRVQATYWRCVVTLFASARITNPDLRRVLFCNAAPPVVDGIDIAEVLARYDVEQHRVPLTARLTPSRTAAWGNVLYFLDILAELSRQDADLSVALVDCDVLTTAPLDRLFDRIEQSSFVGYRIASGEDDDINGMTRRDMAQVASEMAGRPIAAVDHFGGELLGTTMANWQRHGQLFRALFEQCSSGSGPGANILTEEHIYSIALALVDAGVVDGNDVIKRLWTNFRYNTVAAGDEALPLWHLPAEKRYGLADLFRWLAARGFPTDMPPDQLRMQAMLCCGIPQKSAGKLLYDGVRQIVHKLDSRRRRPGR